MALNKSKGNMYPWVTHTWNPVRGRCPHSCSYCYMRRTWDRYDFDTISFQQKDLKINLGNGRKIFVGSSIDMWAEDIPETWILFVLAICQNYPGNEYLFQTKNPEKFFKFRNSFPNHSTLGVTLESNREYFEISKAPSIDNRIFWIKKLSPFPIMISIEPILDFDLEEFLEIIKSIHPSFISIGADSKNHHLPEPSLGKVGEFLIALRKITEVKIKENLKRLL
jgi:DNA repair photolyase